MNTDIYLVRHAHSVYTQDELNRPLSEKGLTDAGRISDILLNENIDYVLASPYRRAIQTVEGVAKNIGIDILIEEDLKERKISEIPVEDFNSALNKLWSDWDFSFDGGESNLEAQRRGINLLNKVLKKYAGKKIVMGTHGNIMVLIMNYFDSIYDFNFWKNLSMPDVYKLSFMGNDFLGAKCIYK